MIKLFFKQLKDYFHFGCQIHPILFQLVILCCFIDTYLIISGDIIDLLFIIGILMKTAYFIIVYFLYLNNDNRNKLIKIS